MQFPERGPVEAVEEGRRRVPLFDDRGLIPAILTVTSRRARRPLCLAAERWVNAA